MGFLRERPPPRGVRARSGPLAPRQFLVRGREIYFHFPNGMGKSKLTNPWFDSRLGTISTMRNWRTVLTLEDMARA